MPSEFDLIARHFVRPTPSAVLGSGDDCALLAPAPGMHLAITTDMLVVGTHFFADTDPYQLGWKTLAVNVSDLAAMGAMPRWALLAASLPEASDPWLATFSEGFFACARSFGVELIGGDTTRGTLDLCVTALGEVPAGEALRRDAARLDDDLWVSGRPGLAALGLAHLQGRAELPEALRAVCIAALQQPMPRVALGLALREQRLASAVIDVSDGLLADLGHILQGSRLAAEVHTADLPCLPEGVDPALARQCQLAGGDDYELLFCANRSQRLALACLSAELDLPLWRIGRLLSGTTGAITLLDENGVPMPIDCKGYDHFS